MTATLRTRDVWALFGIGSTATTVIHRCAIVAGYPPVGSGNHRHYTAAEVAGLLAVRDLGATSNEPAYDARSAHIFEDVRDHHDGFIVCRIVPARGRKDLIDAGWVADMPEWSADGAPVVVASVARYHRLVAEHLGLAWPEMVGAR